jgi:hypothetical protein
MKASPGWLHRGYTVRESLPGGRFPVCVIRDQTPNKTRPVAGGPGGCGAQPTDLQIAAVARGRVIVLETGYMDDSRQWPTA